MRRRLLTGLLLSCACVLPPLWAQETRYFQEGRFLVHEIVGFVGEPVRRVRVETDLGSVSARASTRPETRYRITVRTRGVDDAATRRLLDDMQVSARIEGGALLFRGQ